MPNPQRFFPEEPFSERSASALPRSLQLGGFPINYRAQVIRLLTGTLDIRCQLTNELIEQRSNYSKIVFFTNTRLSTKTLSSSLAPITLNRLGKHLLKNQAKHLNLYKELFHEFSNYFYESKMQQPTKAFLHLYRIIEFSAYSYPIVWASKTNDYEGTFRKLREYFSDPKRGELGVFRMFISDFMDTTFLNSHLTLNISSVHPDWQIRYYESILKAINHIKGNAVSLTPYSQITIEAEIMLDLAITIRNKYFHFLSGDKSNFDSENIPDSNEFFMLINEPLANWLAIILFELIEYEIL